MNFQVSEELSSLTREIRKLTSAYPPAYWREKDKKREYPIEFVEEVAAKGWFRTLIPKEYGGAGLGVPEASAILYELTLSGAGLAGSNACHGVYFVSIPLAKHGTEEQKRKYLPKVATGELRFQTLAITERESGFDTTKIKTFAEKRGNYYLVNGKKVFISRVAESDLILLLARTTPLEKAQRKTKGLSLFIVDLREAGNAIRTKRMDMVSRNTVDTCELLIQDLEVPAENLLGKEGEGLYLLTDALNPEQIFVSSECLGLGKLALQRAVSYAKERMVFDRPIGKNQAIQFPLAEAYMELELAELMNLRAATLYAQGLPCTAEANMAKFAASKAAYKAADHAIQTFGGYGLAESYDVERYWREARLLLIAPISTEMILNYVGEHVLDLPRSY